ncbi:lantibiotic dehydratase [Spirosoma pollinicola]|uniref:Lantibiotic dehydratase n=1 Tax=Spirosoma pollinicola TaxID=2057025 RepID=A0A2K8ZCM0_9BACT|nr:lantibiotic dehydratase [Spirosoma pollinicola]AUD07621.1 lantibiotic dehydratase [Spirosoma pollinicola]
MIQPYSFFILRRPTYSIQFLHQLYNQLDTQPLEAVLRVWYSDPFAQQAIYVASQPLYERCQRWLANEPVSEQKKLMATLYKYLIRMCTRCTPYGLFAGCAVGTIGDKTILRPVSQVQHPYARPSMESLILLKEHLVDRVSVRNAIRVYPNSTLYPVGDTLRYVEQQREDQQRQYFVSSVTVDDYLTALLAEAQNGVTIQELADLLVRYGAEADDAQEYLQQLLDSQLLIHEIEPTGTGISYLSNLLSQLSELPSMNEFVTSMRQLQPAPHLSPDPITLYTATREFFQKQDIPLAGTDPVQVDTFYPDDTYQVSKQVIRTLQKQFEALLVLNQSYQSPDFAEFKRRFYDRYEHEEISLAYALDQECGVGYGGQSTLGVGYAPLIDSLSLPGAETDQTPPDWNWWQTFVLSKFANALRENRPEIELTDADLNHIRQHAQPNPLPSSFYLFGTLLATDEAALDRGDFRFNLLSSQGPSAINLMTRFCDGNPILSEQVRECAFDEEEYHPDVILAEIVHFPESRTGNILTRPSLYSYEIPYMGRSSVPASHQIPLTDLFISIHDEKLVLRSKRLNKRVIPRLSNAHNFQHGLPIYRFLCDLQYQDSYLNVRWNWGQLNQQTYLPRVRYRNMILSRATWLLKRDELPMNRTADWPALLAAKGIPTQFVITVADNELLINTQVTESLHLLEQDLRKNLTIRITEFLSVAEQCPLQQDEHRFTHELILPFRNMSAPVMKPLVSQERERPQRRFSVGSEWLYLKIYTGEKVADTLLVHDIYPIVQQLLSTQIINQFHFVRYKDIDPHLRLRFRGNPHVEFYHYVIRAIERSLHVHIQRGEVHKIQTDTYQRELERYGLEQIDLCENLFYHDSVSTLQFLAQTGDIFDENLRFGFAIHKIDAILNSMTRTSEQRLKLMNEMKERFFDEFKGDSILRQQLNEQYRSYRTLLEHALNRPFPLLNGQENWTDQQAALLRQLSDQTPDDVQLYSIAGSLIHMVVNRLFPSKQRAYELVLYHCLAKYYDSVRARQQTSNEKSTA